MFTPNGYRISFIPALLVLGPSVIIGAEPGTSAPIPPSAADISRCQIFSEPLVPVGGNPSQKENAALLQALEDYQRTGDALALAPLDNFLSQHPRSPWRASLLSSFGSVYVDSGLLHQGMRAWKEAWDLSKNSANPPEMLVADRAAGCLASILAHVGRWEDLERLLAETRTRQLQGSAGERVAEARARSEAMKQNPQWISQCGPVALEQLADALGIRTIHFESLQNMAAQGRRGTNLAELQDMGEKVGIRLVGIKITPDAPIPIPSLFHWRAGHFATVVKEERNRYFVRGFLPGQDLWISRSALNAEAGHYALISSELAKKDKSWTVADHADLEQAWGTGGVTDTCPDDAGDPDCDDCHTKPNPAMAGYSIAATTTSLKMSDTPVWYSPPVGNAIAFSVSYTQRDANQPTSFSYSNLGQKWTFDWLSYVQDDPANPGQSTVVYRNGGTRSYTGYVASTGVFAPQFRGYDVLARTSSTSYERRLPDGSKEVFSLAVGTVSPRKVFMTSMVDPAGNTINLGYDAQNRLVTVTDPLGQITRLSYGHATDPLKITQVTDPFGRSATFQYNASLLLSQVTDMGGISSSFAYGPTAAAPSATADFINALTTPYGTTTFAYGTNGVDRWIQATDPQGESERAEFHNYTGSMPASESLAPSGFTNSYLYYRNTFYWNKRAFAQGGGDWTQTRIYHWCHSSTNGSLASATLESLKKPLEGRVWYSYGQNGTPTYSEGPSSLPLRTARIMDGGYEQNTYAQYNAWGKVTQSTDALGRVTTYMYSTDGQDLMEVHNTTGGVDDLLAKYTYNTQHRPLTVTDAAGQITTFTYNAAGQVLTVKNPKNEITTLSYTGGYLQTITGPVTGAVTSFTYDSVGRVRTVTDPSGYVLTYDYDNLDRKTQVTFPDGTTEQTVYDRLDAARVKDRLNRWTLMEYNPLRELVQVQDSSGRTTQFSWCGCGGGQLESLVDPLGRVTNWGRDLEGRVISKIYPDWSQTLYDYDGAGRLASRVDAKGQVTSYSYFMDNNLSQVAYANAAIATPSASYTYDTRYNRLATSAGLTGTTNYTYYPITGSPSLGAGRLATVTSPWSNSAITYSYDALGRVTQRSINGTLESRVFDTLGRISSVTNPLGTFGYTYDGPTNRLTAVTYPSGQTTNFTYSDLLGDKRLQSIQNQTSAAATISAFAYTYDATGQIQTWTQQADAQTPKVYTFNYDPVNQLLGAVLKDSVSNQILKTYVYGYDDAGNRTQEQINGGITTSTFNPLNQLAGQTYSATP